MQDDGAVSASCTGIVSDIRRALDSRRSRLKEALAGWVGVLGLRSLVSADDVSGAAQKEAKRLGHPQQAFELSEYMELFANFDVQPVFGCSARGTPAPADQRDRQLDEQERLEAQHAGIESDARAQRERDLAAYRAHPDLPGEPPGQRESRP